MTEDRTAFAIHYFVYFVSFTFLFGKTSLSDKGLDSLCNPSNVSDQGCSQQAVYCVVIVLDKAGLDLALNVKK